MAGEEFDTGTGSSEAIRALLGELLGPDMGNFLTGIVAKGVQGATHNSAVFPGGASAVIGEGSMFAGARAIELQTANMFVARTIENNMIETAKVNEGFRQDLRQGLSKNLFGEDAASGLSALNLASDYFLYGNSGMEDFSKQMTNAARYMGVVSPGMAGDAAVAMHNNKTFNSMSTFMAADFAYNRGQYNGMSGSEAGAVVAEMARGGAFANLNIGDLNAEQAKAAAMGGPIEAGTESTRAKLAELQQKVQSATGVISEFQRVLKTDVEGAIDAMSNMFGTDVMQTFSSARLSTMTGAMSSTALATGFSSEQVLGLGSASQQVMQQAGISNTMGAFENGILSAQILAASRQEVMAEGNTAGQFVNEQRFRNTVVQRVTGASVSGLALDLSGAAAIIARTKGQDTADAFLRDMPAGELTSSQLAGLVNKVTGGDVNADDLRDASFSREARLIAATGATTNIVLQNNAAFMESVREQTLRRTLKAQGKSDEQIDSMIKSIDGPLTSSNVRNALGDDATADTMDRIFSQNARAFGFGNMEEADLFLNTIKRNKALANIQGTTKSMGDVQKFVAGVTDAASGYDAFSRMALSTDEDSASLGKLLTAVTGAENIDVGALFGDKGNNFSVQGGTERQNAIRKVALGAATAALFSGKFGSRDATEEEIKDAKLLFSTTDEKERQRILKSFDEKTAAGDGTQALMYEINTQELQKKYQAGSDDPLTAAQEKNIRDISFLNQFDTVKDRITVEGGEGSEDEVAFDKKVNALKERMEAAVKSGKTLELSAEEKETMRQAKREGALNEDIAGVKTDSMTKLSAIAAEILEYVKKM